jgi:6-phosphogluconate dehydrogenase
MSAQLSDVGVAGLCSAGRILALRLAATGARVSLWNSSAARVEDFVAQNAGTRGGLVGYSDREDFVASLNTPRRIVMFETAPRSAASLRTLLHATDLLLEYPLPKDAVPSGDIEQLELALLFLHR